MMGTIMSVLGALQQKAQNHNAANQQMNQLIQQGMPQQQQVQPFTINSVFGR